MIEVAALDLLENKNMNGRWIILSESDQLLDYTKLVLAGDLSLPKPPPPKIPEITIEQLSKNISTVFENNPWLVKAFQDAPSWPELMSVQPMTAPTGIVFEMVNVTQGQKIDEKKRAWEIMSEGLQEGEILKEYEFDYGDWLSMRGGYFVVHKDNPNFVLRYCQTRMS
jgi:hypothetical protein